MQRVVACGVDIVDIERVRGIYARHGGRFVRRICCEAEREELARRRDPIPYLAGRFAAKEAVLKVLGCGIFAGVSLASIEIRARDSGEPWCSLTAGAAARAAARGIASVLVSISHCDCHAVAQALGIGPGGPS